MSLAERWLLVGTSGSGKTTYAKHLILELRKLYPEVPVYILDSKGDPKDFGNWRGIVEQDGPPRPIRERGGVQVWRPSSDNLLAYDQWFENIKQERSRAIVLVDELSSISSPDGRAVLGYQKLQKQGRGPEISVITLTQEMAGTARQARGQASHFVRFALLGEYDRRVANVLGGRKSKDPEPGHKYGFWYTRLDERPYKPLYYPSWKSFF